MRTSAVLTNELDKLTKQLDGLFETAETFRDNTAKATELTATLATIESLQTDVDALEAEKADADKFESRVAANAQRRQAINTPAPGQRPAMPVSETLGGVAPVTTVTGPPVEVLSRLRTSTLSSFTGTREERAAKAYGFGKWFLATMFKEERALDYCKHNGIETRAQVEGTNAYGGYLVPEQFDSDIIILRETYGVFRRNAKISGMTSDTKVIPRRVSGLTAYFLGENQTITDSTAVWDQVRLTAKKLAVLTKYSSEVNEDAIVEMANTLAGEIAWLFALQEDQCGFLGDGSSTYGGIKGLSTSFLSLTGTIANIAGLTVASGNLMSEILLTDFNAVKGKLPLYARMMPGGLKWYASQFFYADVMEKLMLAAGGVSAAEVALGRNDPVFMGYPVEIVQVMPSTDANSQIVCYFGNLMQAALFGDRRETTIALSNELYFAQDELAIRGTERFDINVHDVGNQSGTAGLRVPGPIVGLITAAS